MKTNNEQTILITGSTDGIGYLTALNLAQTGAHILVHGRNPEKIDKTVKSIGEITGNSGIAGLTADLSSLNEVRKLADEIKSKYPQIDVLINNAGVGFAGDRYGKDGYELRFTVNYLAPFLLTHLLLPELKNGHHARIVNVASAGQSPVNVNDLMFERNFNGTEAYSRSKLALVMFTMDLAEILKNDNISVNSLHPGTYLDTNMVRQANISPLGKPESGAEAEVFLATSPEVEGTTGKYFNVMTESRAHPQAYDRDIREKLWDKSMELTGLSG